jgi:hypothetical protein
MRRAIALASNARSFLCCNQDLTRFPLLRDLFRQVKFNERLIRNIFFIGQDLELIGLAGKSKRNRFHRSFNARVKFNFDPALLGKSKYSVVSWVLQKSRSSCSFLNFGTGLIFFFIHFPLCGRSSVGRTHRCKSLTVQSISFKENPSLCKARCLDGVCLVY